MKVNGRLIVITGCVGLNRRAFHRTCRLISATSACVTPSVCASAAIDPAGRRVTQSKCAKRTKVEIVASGLMIRGGRTCDGRLDVDHRLLLAQKGGALVDDPQSGRLLDAALEDEVLLEHVRARLARLGVEHLGHRQLAARRERHTCNQKKRRTNNSLTIGTNSLTNIVSQSPIDCSLVAISPLSTRFALKALAIEREMSRTDEPAPMRQTAPGAAGVAGVARAARELNMRS